MKYQENQKIKEFLEIAVKEWGNKIEHLNIDQILEAIEKLESKFSKDHLNNSNYYEIEEFHNKELSNLCCWCFFGSG